MTEASLLVETDARGVCVLTLNRPERRNAFDDALIAALIAAFDALSADDAVRAVVLRGAGRSFSAGADLRWMKRMAAYSEEENRADALALTRMLRSVHRCAKPVIARVHGAAVGGGVGLAAACDMAVAAEGASFRFSETALGLIPAAIAPYVVRAMGARACQRYFLTAERFAAAQARRLGLVCEVVPEEALDRVIDGLIEALLANGPRAVAACKALIDAVADRPMDEALAADVAARIAALRVSPEGQEGLGAVLEKRKPSWESAG